MHRSVFLFLVHCVWGVLTQFDGDRCIDLKGQEGICVHILKCSGAVEDLHKGIKTKICDFVKDEPIVCCAMKRQPPPDTSRVHTTQSPPTSTTEYEPTEAVYVELGEKTECRAIRNFTAKSTDRISWKKCLQYQEELVYPCKEDPLGNKARVNNCKHSVNQLITGGVEAGEEEFPHMVALSYSEDINSFEYGCGASLISDWFILTAAHCTYKANVGEVQYAATGVLKQANISKSRIYKIALRLQFPRYDPRYHYLDIALLKTETRMKLDSSAVPTCLDLGDYATDSEALATGWGAMFDGGEPVDHLQKVVLRKFTEQECSTSVKNYRRRLPGGLEPNTQICYGDKEVSRDACKGDSGGPLQVKMKRVTCMYSVIGIASFGRGCGTIGRPGVYTRISPFVPWIESVVWPNEKA